MDNSLPSPVVPTSDDGDVRLRRLVGGVCGLWTFLCLVSLLWHWFPWQATAIAYDSAILFRHVVFWLIGLVGIYFGSKTLSNIDRSELNEAEQALRANETKYRGITERSFDIICLMDPEGYITYASSAASKILGVHPDTMVGRHFREYISEADMTRALNLFRNRITGKENGIVELELMRSDGRKVFVEVNSAVVREQGRVVAVQSVVRDITDRVEVEQRLRDMEQQLAHVGRLSMMGEMAAGIAHEVNQPLSAIVSYADACLAGQQTGLISPDELESTLKKISDLGQHAGAIIHRLRSLIARRASQRTSLDMNTSIGQMLALMAYDFRKDDIDVQTAFDHSLPLVWADPVQMHQIVLNLIRNAIDAMRSAGNDAQRILTIQTRATDAGDVVVSVSDTGCGIPEDQLETIFDAFVTSKPEGLGMGLSISRSLAEANEGQLRLDRTSDRGTTFLLIVPALPATGSTGHDPNFASTTDSSVTGSTNTR